MENYWKNIKALQLRLKTLKNIGLNVLAVYDDRHKKNKM